MASAFFKKIAPVTSVLSSALAVFCPLCIPALAAILGAVGLGFALRVEVLRNVLIVLLLVSILSLSYSVWFHKQWRVFVLGLAGAGMVYVGRYIWFSMWLMGIGSMILIIASIWNLRAKYQCNQCETKQG